MKLDSLTQAYTDSITKVYSDSLSIVQAQNTELQNQMSQLIQTVDSLNMAVHDVSINEAWYNDHMTTFTVLVSLIFAATVSIAGYFTTKRLEKNIFEKNEKRTKKLKKYVNLLTKVLLGKIRDSFQTGYDAQFIIAQNNQNFAVCILIKLELIVNIIQNSPKNDENLLSLVGIAQNELWLEIQIALNHSYEFERIPDNMFETYNRVLIKLQFIDSNYHDTLYDKMKVDFPLFFEKLKKSSIHSY